MKNTSIYSSLIVFYKMNQIKLLREIINDPKAAVAAASLAIIFYDNNNVTIINPPPIPKNPVINPEKKPPK